MLKLRSDKAGQGGFLSYLKGKKGAPVVAALLLVGFVLLIAGDSSGSSSSEALTDEEKLEKRLEELCSSVDGVGQCKVMVSCTTVGKSYGSSGTLKAESVVILCRGGGSEKVKRELTELMISLLGIGANRVKIGVLKKK